MVKKGCKSDQRIRGELFHGKMIYLELGAIHRATGIPSSA